MHKKCLEILVAFMVLQFLLMIRLYFVRLGSSVHYFEHVIKQETHIFTKMIINNYQNFTRFYQNFTKKKTNFLENSRNFTKSKTFYQIWSHWQQAVQDGTCASVTQAHHGWHAQNIRRFQSLSSGLSMVALRFLPDRYVSQH
jgi:hypothetical protein